MSASAPPVAEPRAGRREWLGLVVLALPTILISMDLTVLYMALPHLSADLGPDSIQMLWIVDIYAFVIAGFLVTMGTLGDRIGRRRLLMIGATAFGIASVLSAYANSTEMLIAARALLGIAGATLQPSTMSLITNMFKSPKQRAAAFGIWATSFEIGAMAGPVIGGLLLERFWWGSVFLLGVPVMVLLLIAAPILLPEYKAPGAGKLDFVSVFLSLATMLPVIYGLKQIAKHGWQVGSVVSIVVGVLIGWMFLRRQRGLADPVLDVNLFRSRSFTGALNLQLLCMITLSGLTLYFTQYLQLVKGQSPFEAGLWMLPFVGGTIVGANLGPALARRYSPGYVIAGGLSVSAVGFLMLTQLHSGSNPALLAVGAMVITIGLAPLMVLTADLVVGSAPPERSGSASSMHATVSELGMALGAAILGTLGTALYRDQMRDAVPADAPGDAAASARDTLAGAVAEIGRLGDAVVDAARSAFTDAFNVISTISVVVMIALTVLSVATLRKVPPSGQAADAGESGEPVEKTSTPA